VAGPWEYLFLGLFLFYSVSYPKRGEKALPPQASTTIRFCLPTGPETMSQMTMN
jgi:hypothetical protein